MIIGDTLFYDGNTVGEGNTLSYYSPWFPRRGNRARMTCHLIAYGGNFDDFTVEVQTKNSEQSDSDINSATNPVWSQSITLGFDVEQSWIAGERLDDTASVGLLELVRFKYTLSSEEDTDTGWVHFRMLAPQWFTN